MYQINNIFPACVLALLSSISVLSRVAGAQPTSLDSLSPEELAALSEDEIAALAETVIVIKEEQRAGPKAPIGEQPVTAAELRQMPGARGDALSALKSMPGVANASGFTGAGGDLVIRGAAAEDSVYLLDGIQIPTTMHFGNVQSVLPTQMMEEIRFAPGGFGVSYGDSTAGLVHIQSTEYVPDTPTGFVELSFINVGAYLAGPISKSEHIGFQLSFRRSIVDAILPLVMPDDLKLDFSTYPQYYDAQFKLDWRPNHRHHLFLQNIGSGDYLAVDIGEEDPLDPSAKGSLEGEISFWRSYVVWDFQGEELQSRMTVAVGADHVSQEEPTRAYYVKPWSVEMREDLKWDISKALVMRMGGHIKYTHKEVFATYPRPGQEGVPIDPNLTLDPALAVNETIKDLSFGQYLAIDSLLPYDLQLTTGIRMDHYGHMDSTAFLPRISATYPIYQGGLLRASYGKYARPLHLAEAVSNRLHHETSTQLQVAFSHRFDENVQGTLTGFRTDFSELVVQTMDFTGGDIAEAYENLGTGHSYGAELMLRLQGENLRGWLAYTYTRSKRQDRPESPQRLFDFDQPHNLVAVANWHHKHWQFGGKFQISSGAPHTPVVDSIYHSDQNTYRPIYGATNSKRLETSHQLDLRISREFRMQHWNLSVYLDVTNVYANAPVTGYSYGFDYRESETDTGESITPAIGLKGEF